VLLCPAHIFRREFLVPHPMRRKASDQVLIQLIEADVESGFGLVDEAKASRVRGNGQFSARALQAAEAIVVDIEQRLQKLGEDEAAAFLPLVEELREQIAEAGQD
jgi:hypothetical protein